MIQVNTATQFRTAELLRSGMYVVRYCRNATRRREDYGQKKRTDHSPAKACSEHKAGNGHARTNVNVVIELLFLSVQNNQPRTREGETQQLQDVTKGNKEPTYLDGPAELIQEFWERRFFEKVMMAFLLARVRATYPSLRSSCRRSRLDTKQSETGVTRRGVAKELKSRVRRAIPGSLQDATHTTDRTNRVGQRGRERWASKAVGSVRSLPLNHVVPIAGVWQKRKASLVPALRARINRINGPVVGEG